MGQGLSGVREKLPGVLGGKSTGGASGGQGSPTAAAATEGPGDKAIGCSSRQFTVDEAVALQRALKAAFAEESFQKLLRRAEAMHPKRGTRGHADQQAFMAQMQGLLLHVYRTVLPRKPWCLSAGWEGYREMLARTVSVAEDPRVVKLKEEINTMLGLPRHTVLRPPTEEPVFVATPDGTGGVPTYAVPMVVDGDGDAAHEFWEEDRGGQLRKVLPATAAAAGCGD